MKLVIVESPAKAKTINKYLGADFKVLASYGHIRDLPSKDGSVLPDDDFAMVWDMDTASKKRVLEIANAAKQADTLILATDPDREGEAISWHVLEVLKKRRVLGKKPVQRVVFNAITKKAVTDAMAQPRDLDVPLIDAYLARRALDYLVGFTLSPVLWRKLPGSRSAGRVQSVALRMVCEHEDKIEKFVPVEYWSVPTVLDANGQSFSARLYAIDGHKLEQHGLKTRADAEAAKAIIQKGAFSLCDIEQKPLKRNPYAPFTTSTLQQDASSKLGFAPARTMHIAQKLYEGVPIGGETVGLITYMRTDGVQMAPEAIAQTRDEIAKLFGETYLPSSPRIYNSKAKNAQEAHEAIRPTSLARHPDTISGAHEDMAKLYRLIWTRTMAAQMQPATLNRTTATIHVQHQGQSATLRATGSVVGFDGFMRVYAARQKDDDAQLPPLVQGQELTLQSVETRQHFTEPPARYSEASLIKKMEELGIGRPSTYAATLSTLQNRDYVRLEKKALWPEDRGRLVTAFLQSFFNRWVAYDFTASLEEQLDKISDGSLKYKDVLADFWRDFSHHVDEIKDLRVSQVLDALNALLGDHIFPAKDDGSDPRLCPTCHAGRLSLKIGRYGAFIGCSNYPECKHTQQLSEAAKGETTQSTEPNILGIHPETGLELSLRTGRFGPYVQLGEDVKPKRVSIPKGWDAAHLTLEEAIKLIDLPRNVGKHPDDDAMITAGIGRYGPFVHHNATYANLSDVEEVFTVGLNRAVTLLAERQTKGGGRRSGAATLKDLGEHPDGGSVTVKDGRYGPYVNHGKINATLPKDMAPDDVTLQKALELIEAKAGLKKSGTKKTKTKASTKTNGTKTTKTTKTKAKAKKVNEGDVPAGADPF